MGLWDMIAIMFIAIFGYAAYEARLKHGKKQAANDSVNEELENLKERVATLEKIVTDKKYSLKQEIDNL